ncbi:MAG: N-acetyltransferase family protein [Candidatus Thorarchaeota archaeon]|jgi:ribosomal protein S18 acetylase RimI-like enzyme
MSPNKSVTSKRPYTIRVADKTDAKQISVLYKRVWDEFDNQFPKELRESRQPSEDVMKQWMMSETYLVAVLRGNIIGVVGCRLMHGTCQLTHMAVDKPHRGKGVGAGLTERVIEFAKENGSMKVWLDTAPFMKEAISLYEKFGFTKCGYLSKHFWGLDMELYELVLSS